MDKAKIEVSERDLKMLSNVSIFFKNGQFNLNGTEILVCAQTQEYIGSLIKAIQAALNPPKAPMFKVESSEEAKKKEKDAKRKPKRKAIVKDK